MIDVDTCRPIASLTSSVTLHLVMFYGQIGADSPAADQQHRLNDGYQRLRFPLYPGWRSINNQRYVTTGGESWNDPRTSGAEATITNTLVVRNSIALGISNNSAVPSMIRSTGGHSSGKKYFEVLLPFNTLVVGNEAFAGVANGSLTFSGTSGNFIGVGLQSGPQFKTYRYGVTISALSVFTAASFSANGEFWRPCVAVDIDLGQLWIGCVAADGSRVWHGGGDPSTATSPTATFTASSTMYCAVGVWSSANIQTYLWAAWQSGAFRFDPPTGFDPWDGGAVATTTTATITPSFTGSVTTTSTASATTSGGGGGTSRVKWPFGVRP